MSVVKIQVERSNETLRTPGGRARMLGEKPDVDSILSAHPHALITSVLVLQALEVLPRE